MVVPFKLSKWRSGFDRGSGVGASPCREPERDRAPLPRVHVALPKRNRFLAVALLVLACVGLPIVPLSDIHNIEKYMGII